MAYSAVKVKTDTSAQIYGISALVLLMGVVALLLLFGGMWSIVETRAVDEDFGTTLLRYLDENGIIVPLIEVVAGVYLIRLGLQLLHRDVRAAQWTRQLLLWGILLAAVLTIQSVGAALSAPQAATEAYGLPIILFLLTIGIGYSYVWLGTNIDQFEGQETLAETSSRSAWKRRSSPA
jgi:hypothetical protein